MNKIFHHTLQVHYDELDAYGVVHHSEFLRYFERARYAWLKQAVDNKSYTSLTEHYLFPIRHIEIDYLAPARGGDRIDVAVEVEKKGSCSIIFRQCITTRDHDMLCKARIKVACVDKAFNLVNLPELLRS